jgi:glyoxylase-like metal-dependent hydrolase (beta-lactamase superfamily II)
MPKFLLFFAALFAINAQAETAYQPKLEKVVDNVYAIVGPTVQRSPENDGLNANYGVIVTDRGVILIDSGASSLGAEKLAGAIAKITKQPVRWVIDTGSQDHRWLGNDWFAAHGAEIIAMKRTAATQAANAAQALKGMSRFLGDRMQGTKALPATHTLDGDQASLQLGGETLELRYTDTHFPGDAWVWLPKHKVIFTGDLVFVDRMLGIPPSANIRNGQRAFRAMEALQPVFIVPGHGRVSDLARARRDTGDYYDFLIDKIAPAARNMDDMETVLNKYAEMPAFRHLEHYDELHRANMNQAYTQFISE